LISQAPKPKKEAGGSKIIYGNIQTNYRFDQDGIIKSG
jgi:hypothetical protein